MKKLSIGSIIIGSLLLGGCEVKTGTTVRDVRHTVSIIEQTENGGEYETLLSYRGHPIVDKTEAVYKLCKKNKAGNGNILLNLRLTEVDGRLEHVEVVNVNK